MMHIDFESRATVDIKVGAWAYWAHPDTEITRLAYGTRVDDVRCWLPGDPPPLDLFAHIESGGLVAAFNSFFEYSGWYHKCVAMGWPAVPDDNWRCTQAQAYAYGLSGGSLEQIGALINPSHTKDSLGHDLMMLVCKPIRGKYRTDEEVSKALKGRVAPEDVQQRLTDYCKQDVRAEIALSEAVPPLTDTELRIWQASEAINRRGVRVDLTLARNAPAMFNTLRDGLNDEISVITDGVITKVTQATRIKKWLCDRGMQLDDLSKDTVTNLLKDPDTVGEERRVLELRQAGGKSSISKFDSMTESAVKGRLYGQYSYCLAHTRRWASKPINLQNLISAKHPVPGQDVEPYELETTRQAIRNNDIEWLQMMGHPLLWITNSVRSALVPDGVFVDVDYAGIEMRFLAWLANERGLLKRIAEGKDEYRHMASETFGASVDEVTKLQRAVGKVIVLMSGYQGGWLMLQGKLWTMAGMSMSDAFCQNATESYRRTNPNIKRLWRLAQDAAMFAIRHPGRVVSIALTAETGGEPIRYERIGDNLFCHLPSGRPITYWHPRIAKRPAPWDDTQLIDQILVSTPKHKSVKMHGGLLVENFVQATCRDLLGYHMVKLEDDGFATVLHTHDEFTIDEPDESRVEQIVALLRSKPAWLGDFPHSTGHWTGKFFRKD